jgi:hypothetical protein
VRLRRRCAGISRSWRSRALLPVLAVAILVAGCGAGASHYAAVLDSIQFPAGWQLVHTASKDGIAECTIAPNCPYVTRWYLVEGQPIDALASAKQAVTTAGFTIDHVSGPKCDFAGGPACLFEAYKDQDALQITLENPGDDEDGLGLAQQGKTLIRVMSYGK